MTRSLFSRLYARGERGGRSQLEDYVTEAFGSVFDRLDAEARRSLLHALIDRSTRSLFDQTFEDVGGAVLATQVSLDATGRHKRPDMVLRLRGRDVLIIEAKLGAAMVQHVDADASTTDGAGGASHTQLATYARWIGGRNAEAGDAWPGAVIMLTAWTAPPAGFPSQATTGVRESVRTWTHVAHWIVANASRLEPLSRALCGELLAFLKEKNLLDRYFDARDLATLTLYAASDDAFRHTTRTAMKAIATAHPALGPFRPANIGVDTSIGAYVGWIYLNQPFQAGGSRFWLGLGICGDPSKTAFDEDLIRTIGREPFVMIYWGDEYTRERPIDHVSSHPMGWVEVKIRPALIVTRPIREFAGDPEGRAEEIKTWACDQVGTLAPLMKSQA